MQILQHKFEIVARQTHKQLILKEVLPRVQFPLELSRVSHSFARRGLDRADFAPSSVGLAIGDRLRLVRDRRSATVKRAGDRQCFALNFRLFVQGQGRLRVCLRPKLDPSER